MTAMIQCLHELEGATRVMEVKLETILAGGSRETIVDEHGVLGKCFNPNAAHCILPATTKGLRGQAIQGFHQNGTLFTANLSDARKYFGSMGAENRDGRGPA